jgi:5-methylcytosine-specific restriction endonuclease McrA
MEHVTPLVLGGKARLKENIVTACAGCNKEKGPLTQEVLDADITPYALADKFYETVKKTAERAGHYKEWIKQFD